METLRYMLSFYTLTVIQVIQVRISNSNELVLKNNFDCISLLLAVSTPRRKSTDAVHKK